MPSLAFEFWRPLSPSRPWSTPEWLCRENVLSSPATALLHRLHNWPGLCRVGKQLSPILPCKETMNPYYSLQFNLELFHRSSRYKEEESRAGILTNRRPQGQGRWQIFPLPERKAMSHTTMFCPRIDSYISKSHKTFIRGIYYHLRYSLLGSSTSLNPRNTLLDLGRKNSI